MKYASVLLVVFTAASFGTIGIAADPIEYCEPDSYQTESIDQYEVRKVGTGNAPPAEVFGLEDEGLYGDVYVEIDPTMIKDVFVEFYAIVGVESDDCKADGILITDEVDEIEDESILYGGYMDIFEPTNQDECFPRTKNGAIAAVKFIFNNIHYTEPENMKIWDPDAGDTEGGLINLCVRVGYKKEINGLIELVSFLDTKIRGNVDLTANFNSFEQVVPITDVIATVIKTEFSCSIDIHSFLCEPTGEQDGFPTGGKYGLGQVFHICVDVTEEYTDDYKVTGFEDVVCENGLDTRELVTKRVMDPLTTVETNIEGSSNIDGTLIATTNTIAIVSVATAGFFNSNGDDSSFDCRGEVQLEYIGEEGGNKGARCNKSTISARPSSIPSSIPSSKPSTLPSNIPSNAPSVNSDRPSSVNSDRPSTSLIPSSVPSLGPSLSPSCSMGACATKSYTFPKPGWFNKCFQHGLCVYGAKSAAASTNNNALSYTPINDFDNDVQMWADGNYKATGVIDGPNMCKGGLYLQPSKFQFKPRNKQTEITLSAEIINGCTDLIICAILEDNIWTDGNWPKLLEDERNFTKSKIPKSENTFRWIGNGNGSGETFANFLRTYCKVLDDSFCTTSTSTSTNERGLSGSGQQEQEQEQEQPHHHHFHHQQYQHVARRMNPKPPQSDNSSPFVTTIQLSTVINQDSAATGCTRSFKNFTLLSLLTSPVILYIVITTTLAVATIGFI